MKNINVNCLSLVGNEAHFVKGQCHWVKNDKIRITNDDTGIVTLYRLTHDFYHKGGDINAAG